MKSKLLYILLLTIGFSGAINAQLNNYKYIIVPKKFEDFKSVNQYQTSTLTKYFFTENGFEAVYDDALPADLANERCLGLVANLIDGSSMFTTKVTITLKDCNNVEVYRSIEGVSKIKEYDDSYKEALQRAFVSFAGMNYAYEPKEEKEFQEETAVTVSFKDDVKSVETSSKEQVFEQKATMEEQVYKSVEPKASNIVKAAGTTALIESIPTGILYAQSTENGYQLVDKTPKVVLKLEETSMQDVFMTDFQGNNAVVFKKEDKWLLEYSENGKKVQQELNIKF